jgi:hypothetical protein
VVGGNRIALSSVGRNACGSAECASEITAFEMASPVAHGGTASVPP